MATCKDCGKKFGYFDGSKDQCYDCRYRKESDDARAARTEEEQLLIQQRNALAAIILTTETAAQDLRIVERLGVVSAECAFGMNAFKDIFAVGRDLFGGRSAAIQNTLKDARNVALEELKLEALQLGANAVVGVDLDYSEISGGGKSMLFLVATGTAVRIA